MKYRLSNRQIKELLIRGVSLNIAIPAPPGFRDDWRMWAREAIVEHGRHVVSAEKRVIRVRPATMTKEQGLSGMLGHIDDGESPCGDFFVQVVVIACRMEAAGKPRGELQLQWPKCAVEGDREWP